MQKVGELTETLVSEINEDIAEVFENQKMVEKDAKALNEKVTRFKEQTRRWEGSLKQFDETLKGIGDFEMWVQVMEKDLGDVAEALER